MQFQIRFSQILKKLKKLLQIKKKIFMLNFCDNSRFTYKRSSNTGLHNVSYKRERGFLFSGNFFSFSSGKCIGAKEKYWKFADGEGKWSREKRLLFSFNYNSTCLSSWSSCTNNPCCFYENQYHLAEAEVTQVSSGAFVKS